MADVPPGAGGDLEEAVAGKTRADARVCDEVRRTPGRRPMDGLRGTPDAAPALGNFAGGPLAQITDNPAL